MNIYYKEGFLYIETDNLKLRVKPDRIESLKQEKTIGKPLFRYTVREILNSDKIAIECTKHFEKEHIFNIAERLGYSTNRITYPHNNYIRKGKESKDLFNAFALNGCRIISYYDFTQIYISEQTNK